MTVFYNEFDKYAAKWLINLSSAGHIAQGVVDTRSIQDIHPHELDTYTQCHFFAGIGIWSYALRAAGWPDDVPVWTGSCPCQPFSKAGKGRGVADERHLWPDWYWLIQRARKPPAVIFGEQVASKDAEAWFDLVRADLEALDYTVGAVAFPAAGVGAPNMRDRLYWVAYSNSIGFQGFCGSEQIGTAEHSEAGQLADAEGFRPQRHAGVIEATGRSGWHSWGALGHLAASNTSDGLANTNGDGCAENRGSFTPYRGHGLSRDASLLTEQPQPGPVNGFWRNADWLHCQDRKWRPVEPGTFPLANGHPSRVGRLRAYGNALNAEAAIIFIESFMEFINEIPVT